MRRSTIFKLKTREWNGRRLVHFAWRSQLLLLPLCFFVFGFGICVSCHGQTDEPELAPPPLKVVTKDERSTLDAEHDLRSKTKLALELMASRITAAERSNAAGDFEGLFRELGRFKGLLDYSFSFLKQQNANDKRTLDNYKRIDMSLRGFIPRVEMIRRELPVRYGEYVRDFLLYLRDSRDKAMEPMFSDTVLPNAKQN